MMVFLVGVEIPNGVVVHPEKKKVQTTAFIQKMRELAANQGLIYGIPVM